MDNNFNISVIARKIKSIKGYRGDQVLITLCYLFLITPIIIFLFGWLKPLIAVVSTVILVFGAYQTIKNFTYIESRHYINFRFVVITIFVISIWVILSGIGGFGSQNYDFHSRNAIFRDLIDQNWPVIYDFSENPIISNTFGETGALVYYFHYWLPSALIGKLSNWMTANYFLFSWSIIGAVLSILLITRYIGRPKLVIPLVFIFWSGLDILGSSILNHRELISQAYVSGIFSIRALLGNSLVTILDNKQLEWWSGAHLFQYSSFTTQLFWVFNQSIPAWLTTLLLLNQQKRNSIIFTYSLILFFAPLPAIGLFPFLIFKLIKPEIKNIRKKIFSINQFVKQTFSYQNVAPPVLVASLALLYFSTTAGSHPHGFIWSMSQLVWHNLLYIYLLFCFVEFFLFSLFGFNGKSEKIILIFTIIILFIIPLYQYGSSNDFVMRASIPPLIVLFTISFKNIFTKYQEVLTFKREIAVVILIIILAIGSITPYHEIIRSRDYILVSEGFPDFADSLETLEAFDDNHPVYRLEWITQFVSFDHNADFFFAYLTR